jgi:D-serine deaminase-like pyridoxal phosphate-dependent protein
MDTINDLATPALLLDLDVLERNLEAMQAKADRLGVALRPHIKTHKCIEVGERQRALGALGIAVSTLPEARVFADHGFDDITWAFPLIFVRLEEVVELAERITLRLVVDSAEAVQVLEQTGRPLHVWLKVDCGYHRVGVNPRSATAMDLTRAIHESRTLEFDGILTHAGHTYDGPTQQESAAPATPTMAPRNRKALPWPPASETSWCSSPSGCAPRASRYRG